MKVAVVGAGLGGLCLAHGLRRNGVEVAVYERRARADHPPSYGIHLDADGLAALHAALPGENRARLAASSDPAPDVVRFRDTSLRTLAVLDREGPRRAVRRDALHDALLLGLDDAVHRGAEFVGYREGPARVEAVFADGAAVAADLLVGADSANSRVRAGRFPGLDRIDLGIVNVAGRVELTPALAAALPTDLIDGSVNNVVPPGAGWLFASTWERSLVWAWVGRVGSYPDGVMHLPAEQLRELVAARVAGWAPGLRALVEATPAGTVTPIGLRTMPALTPWSPSRVTLLGDAIHAMTPMAGVGANTALRDAQELCRALRTGGSTVERVGRYEGRMRGYAGAALARSTRNARSAASTARLPRLGFRTALRVAELLPPVKRAMFGQSSVASASANAAGCVT